MSHDHATRNTTTRPESTNDAPSFDRLLHDVRTPLGVAHGYLRMIRDGRLSVPAQQAKALDGVSQALGHLTTLCDAAAGRGPTPDQTAPLDAAAVGAALRARLPSFGIACTMQGDMPPRLVRATAPAEVVDAAVLLVCAVIPAGGSCAIRADDHALVVSRHDDGGDLPILTLPLETPR